MAGPHLERIALSTGISLDVALAGPREAAPILFLHGFPESHRTWRNQIEDLSRDHFVIAPDQRGYARSDKPEGVENYQTDKIVADAMALMDSLGIRHFTLAGHDWGGAAAWSVALHHPLRVKRLIIANAPHPLIFQRSLIEDMAQREASQYVRFFRSAGAEASIMAMGLETFLDKLIAGHADGTKLPEEERRLYLDEWSQPGALTGMLNWYRATNLVVPAMDEDAALPQWTHAPFPALRMPTLVIWGLKDVALLPVQLEGMDAVVPDLRIVTSPTAGHFIPWEEPGTVTRAIRAFLDETGPA
jgi:pimeloyl-ACP methyl ester carboxylesterase